MNDLGLPFLLLFFYSLFLMHWVVIIYLFAWVGGCIVARFVKRLGACSASLAGGNPFVRSSNVSKLVPSEVFVPDADATNPSTPRRSLTQRPLLTTKLPVPTTQLAPLTSFTLAEQKSSYTCTLAHVIAVLVGGAAVLSQGLSQGVLGCCIAAVAADLLSVALRWPWTLCAREHFLARKAVAALLVYGSMLLWPIGMALAQPASGSGASLWGVVAWGAVAQVDFFLFFGELLLSVRQASVVCVALGVCYALCVAGCSAWLADDYGFWPPIEVAPPMASVTSGILFIAYVLLPVTSLLEILWSQLLDLHGDLSEAMQFIDDLHITVEAQQGEVAALKAKSGCVATLAHEVRTPLNALLACCTLLADTALTPEQKEYVNMIVQCGSQMTNNVDHVLESARLEGKKVVLSPCDILVVTLGRLVILKRFAVC